MIDNFPSPKRFPGLIVFIAIFGGALLNGAFQWLEEMYLGWPFFFDSFFTIAVGVFFGWLPGMITGLLSNFFMEVTHGFPWVYVQFAIVNMATGIISGLMARDKKRFWTPPAQIGLILVLTLVNSLLGAYIVTVVFGGLTGTPPDILVSALILTGQNLFTSSFLTRIPLNLVDKGLPVILLYISYRIYQFRREQKYAL
jgi:energy-coupling factor transport system substrate-specific component